MFFHTETMTEFILLISTIFIFLLITIVPFNYISRTDKNISYFDSRIFNLVFFVNLLLLLNLMNLELTIIKNIFYLILLLTIFFNFYLYYDEKKIKTSNNDYLYFVLLFVCLTISISIAYAPTLGWTAQNVWIEKTILFLQNKKIISLQFSPASELPILLPVIWSFFWNLFNSNYEYFGRLFLVFLYLFSILNFLEIFNLKILRKIIAFLILILVSLKIDLFQGDPSILVFSLILLSMKYLYEIILNNNASKFNIILLFLITNLIVWSLNEGIFYAFFIISSLAFFSKIPKIKNFGILVLIGYVFIILFRIYIYKFYNIEFRLNSDDYALHNFRENFNLNNILLISKYMLFNILRTDLLIFTIPLIFYYYAFLKDNKGFRLTMYIILINILFIYFYFLFNGETMEGMLKQKMIPLLFMSSPFYLLPVAIFIKSKLKL